MSKIKVEVVHAFERYKIGDKPEMTNTKAEALEKMGLVKLPKSTTAKAAS